MTDCDYKQLYHLLRQYQVNDLLESVFQKMIEKSLNITVDTGIREIETHMPDTQFFQAVNDIFIVQRIAAGRDTDAEPVRVRDQRVRAAAVVQVRGDAAPE